MVRAACPVRGCENPERDSPAHVDSLLEDLRHAVDFRVPEGTPVMAVADGVVSDMYMGSRVGGPGVEYYFLGNWIDIRHSDGTVSHYEHLAPDSERVRVGEDVRRGQTIARSGSTGWVGNKGAHLHFSVGRVRAGRYVTEPIDWSDPDAPPSER